MVEKSIKWGLGGFAQEDWNFVYNIVKQYHVETVLEYGCGLTTELMIAVGLKVKSLETQEKWAAPYLSDPNFDVTVHKYSQGYPELKTTYDLGFIDGPGDTEKPLDWIGIGRSKAVAHAVKYCSMIYLHDHSLFQYEILNGDRDWKIVGEYKDKNNFYMKVAE